MSAKFTKEELTERANILRFDRIRSGKNQKQIADELGLAEMTISRWELPYRNFFASRRLDLVAEAYQLTPEEKQRISDLLPKYGGVMPLNYKSADLNRASLVFSGKQIFLNWIERTSKMASSHAGLRELIERRG